MDEVKFELIHLEVNIVDNNIPEVLVGVANRPLAVQRGTLRVLYYNSHSHFPLATDKDIQKATSTLFLIFILFLPLYLFTFAFFTFKVRKFIVIVKKNVFVLINFRRKYLFLAEPEKRVLQKYMSV